MKTVTIYSAPGCHLCEEVEAVIERVARRRQFRMEKINILNDPVVHQRYKLAIPVVHVDGTEIARYRLTGEKLEAALRSAAE